MIFLQLKPPTGGPRFFSPAPPSRVGAGERREPRGPVHEFDARVNARPHTTRLLVQAMKRPDGTAHAVGADHHHPVRSL